MIRHLPAHVKACIRTGVALTTFAQAVEELVLNSIDAGASSIAVRVDFSCFKIQVVDNGLGISHDQFQLIGERYSTSKCHTVEDLDNLKYFGYRGEALASLRTAASFLEITSRSRSSLTTYSKCFQNGIMLDVIQASLPRPSVGTTVTAHNLFYNLPVRRKRVNGALEIEKIRYRLAGIALMWPHISFSLRDDSIGHVILQTYKCSKITASFSYIFTPARARGLMEVYAERDEFKLYGIVSKESYSRMDLQFVFVNKRLVLKSSIHRQINKIFGRSLILRRKGLNSDALEKNVNAGGASTVSPQKQIERYAIFAINVECPFSVYDITFDPSKTLVEFRDWPKLIHLLQDMLYGFLRKENLLSTSEPTSSPYDVIDEDENDGDDDEEETTADVGIDMPSQSANGGIKQNTSLGVTHKFGRNMSAVIENGLFSKTVHRTKNLYPEKMLVSSEQTVSMTDHDKEPQTKTSLNQLHTSVEDDAILNISEQNDGQIKSLTNISDSHSSTYSNLESAHIYLHPRNVKIAREDKETSKKRYFDQDSTRKSKDHHVQKNISHCQVTSEGELITPKLLSFESKQHISEDSEEIIVKRQTSLGRKEITLGNSVHYSSTLQNLREIKQTSSLGNVSGIITNTLQQLKHSTQKAVKNVGNLYKTPEKVATFSEDGASPTKLSKMDDDGKAALTNSNLSEVQPVLNGCVSASKNKCKKSFAHNIIDCKLYNMSNNDVEIGNVVGPNIMTLCGKPSSSVTFKSTTEDRSLSQNDRGIALKRTSDNNSSHASKLAKLMKGEMVIQDTLDHVSNSSKHSEILNVFSYSRSQKNIHSKYGKKDHLESSVSIPDKVYTQESDIHSSRDVFLRATNVSADPFSSDRGSGIITSNERERWKTGNHSSCDTHTSCSAVPCNHCCCCSAVPQNKKQLNHIEYGLPFSMYKTAADIVEYTEEETDNSPKVSVILSLPLENVKSQIDQFETLSRTETTKPVLWSYQNRCHQTLDNDALSETRCANFSDTAVTLPLQNQSISSNINRNNGMQKTVKGSTNLSISNTEKLPLIQSQMASVCQSEAEGKHFGSNESTPQLSQGFTVNVTQLEKIDPEHSPDSVSSNCMLQNTNDLFSVRESPRGFDSAGFSPANETLSSSVEESYPSKQSSSRKTSIDCLKNKNTDSPGIGFSHVDLSDSDTDVYIQNMVDREQKGKSTSFLYAESLSSTEDLQRRNDLNEKGLHYSLLSELTLSVLPENENPCNINDTRNCCNHVNKFENTTFEKSLPSDEPVILAYDSLNNLTEFNTVPETEDLENSDRIDNSIVNMKSASATLNRGHSNSMFNNVCSKKENDLTEVKNMIADAKQIFKNMRKSLGISDLIHDSYPHTFNDKKTTASMLQHRHTLGLNSNYENCTSNEIETIPCVEVEISGKNSTRTFIHDETSDCESRLLLTPNDKSMQQDSLNVRCASSSDTIPCGQVIEVENNVANLSSHTSSYSHLLRSNTDYQGTGQVIKDDYFLPKNDISKLAPEHKNIASYLPHSLSSHALLNDIIEETEVHKFTYVNEKECPDISVCFTCSETKKTDCICKNRHTLTSIADSQIHTNKHINTLDPEAPLQIQTEPKSQQISSSQRLGSDQIDVMSSEGDHVLMMIEESVFSPTILSHKNKNFRTKSSINDEYQKPLRQPNDMLAKKEVYFGDDWSENGQIFVSDESTCKGEAEVNNSHRGVKTVRPETCKSDIGLSTSSQALISGSNSHGEVKSDIVASSLSLLKQANLMESDTSIHPIAHLCEKNVSLRNIDLACETELSVSNQNSLSAPQDSSNAEIAGGDPEIQMEETNPAKSAPNEKSVESHEEITKIACWKEVTESETGRKTYVNNLSGHTVNEEQWKQISSQTQRDMLAIPSESVNVISVTGPTALNDNEKQAFTDLVSDHLEQEDNEAMLKWRKGERPVYDKNVDADVSALMARWMNPVFLNYKQPGLLADTVPSGTVARSCFNSLSSVEFTKNMLDTVKVIGQLDNKFIACVIKKPQDFSKVIGSKFSTLLVLFDQHAVHERIRLEHLTKEAYEVENGERTDRIKRLEIRPAQPVTMDQDDLRIMKAFSQEFNRLGIGFSVDKSNRNIVHINSLPLCMVEKDASDFKKKKITGFIESVENLIKEHIELLKSTNGACGRLPLVIHKVLCSQACHGAIKFGDQLTLQECQDLLSSLASCSLPFQCAHGRPSVAPLLNLSALEKELLPAIQPSNLWKISQHLNK